MYILLSNLHLSRLILYLNVKIISKNYFYFQINSKSYKLLDFLNFIKNS